MYKRVSYMGRSEPILTRKIPRPKQGYAVEPRKRGRGAPKGGRVHWLLIQLAGEFWRENVVYYDYRKHCYLIESRSKKNRQIWIVCQTSAACWVITYVDTLDYIFDRITVKNYLAAADYIMLSDCDHRDRLHNTNYNINKNTQKQQNKIKE